MQNHKKFTYIQRDTHKLRTMPNETIHAKKKKNKTENDNYIDKHKEEKV